MINQYLQRILPARKKAEPWKGKVIIGQHSGLRKLMRAANRNMIPDDRMAIIEIAKTNAAKRKK